MNRRMRTWRAGLRMPQHPQGRRRRDVQGPVPVFQPIAEESPLSAASTVH